MYVQNHWARLQNVATPFDTVHDEQEAVVSSLHGLFITTMCAVATSALAGCLLWWSLSVRFWRRAVTATLAVCGIGAAVAVLIILGDAIPGAVILMGHPWIIGASYTATVASLAVRRPYLGPPPPHLPTGSHTHPSPLPRCLTRPRSWASSSSSPPSSSAPTW